jgi:POT family proton-dependent oligopeptide transporter
MQAAPTRNTPSVKAGIFDRAFFAGQPSGLPVLFFTELWERFSYYGMRALLTLFMAAPAAAGGLGFSIPHAAAIYGSYTMAVYMLAIPGGFIADTFLGRRRSVFVGGAVMALGHFALAVPTLASFYLGLTLIALGTGVFKPSISALVGGLYASDDDRRDAGFSIFYMGINIGAFFAPLVTGFLAQSSTFRSWLEAAGIDPALSWHWGFAAAGVGMVLGLVQFHRNAAGLPRDEPPPVSAATWRETGVLIVGTLALLSLLVLSDMPGLRFLRAIVLLLPLAAVAWFALTGGLEGRRIAAVFVFFIAGMIFWAIFEQAGTTVALFADRLTERHVLGWEIPSAWFQSLNALFVILLAPLFAAAWMRLGPAQPTSPVKFVLGLVFLALSFLLLVPAAYLTAAGKVSPLWLVGLFFLQTVGELFLSPVGLSTMTKLAPARFVGLVLGIWFLAMAFGNKLAGVLGSGFTAADPAGLAEFLLKQAALVGVVALLLALATPWVKRLMGGVR